MRPDDEDADSWIAYQEQGHPQPDDERHAGGCGSWLGFSCDCHGLVLGDPLTPPGRFAPLAPDHPLVGRDCVVCLEPFEAGDRVALLDSGKPKEGLTVEADPAHEGCVVWMQT